MRKAGPAIAGRGDGRGPRAKEFGQTLDAGKGKKTDSPPEPPEMDTDSPVRRLLNVWPPEL